MVPGTSIRPDPSMKSVRYGRLLAVRSWWRRGRVELPVQKKVARISYRLSQLS